MATGHKRLTHCECDFFTMNRCETEVIFNFNFRRYKSWHRLKVYFRLAAFCWPCCTVGTVRSKFAFAFKWQSTRNVVAIYFEVYILCAHFMLICTFSPFSIVYAACCIGSKLASELNAKTMPLFVCSIFGQIIKMKWKLLSIWCWMPNCAQCRQCVCAQSPQSPAPYLWQVCQFKYWIICATHTHMQQQHSI